MINQNIVESGNASDKGQIREINEDYFGFYTLADDSVLAIVCDGMGGHNAGEVASQIAVDVISNHFLNDPTKTSIIEELNLSLLEANDQILDLATQNPEQSGMGTTTVVLLLKNDIAYYAHVGDSRIYLVRGSQIRQLTKDHSFVQELLDNGLISAKEAKNHPKRNIILKALGIKKEIEPEVSDPIPIFKDDIFVLCTDGLTEYVEAEEIKNLVSNTSPNNAAQILIDLANKRGGKDNITVQIIKVTTGNNYSKTNSEGY